LFLFPPIGPRAKIKSLGEQEAMKLSRILPDYVAYLEANPGTLLTKFCGLYSVERSLSFFDRFSGGTKRCYLVMTNALPPKQEVHRIFDLKGSSVGRTSLATATDTKDDGHGPGICGVVMKDLDFVQMGFGVHLTDNARQALVEQLRSDVRLLQRLAVMDYSLILGVLYETSLRETSRRRYPRAVLGGYIRLLLAPLRWRRGGRPRDEGAHDLSAGASTTSNGEVVSSDHRARYFLGLIDFLQPYTGRKWLETRWKSLFHKEGISCVHPDVYAERFLDFMATTVVPASPCT
jgi:1-phosphatidylinositol-4-phosphate 5-kinase